MRLLCYKEGRIMQIKCSKCGKTNNAILTEFTLSYGSSSDIPIYNCENCGAHFGGLIYNGFVG
jgi:uncharacterized Zn finger protein